MSRAESQAGNVAGVGCCRRGWVNGSLALELVNSSAKTGDGNNSGCVCQETRQTIAGATGMKAFSQ